MEYSPNKKLLHVMTGIGAAQCYNLKSVRNRNMPTDLSYTEKSFLSMTRQ